MTDKEKYIAVVAFIKGQIGTREYIGSIDVSAFYKFLKEIEK